MHATDKLIFDLLALNGRRSNRQIAKELALPEKQVSARIDKMLTSREMSLLTVTDVFSAGFDFMLFMGIEVAQQPVDIVAKALSSLPEVLSVMLMMGNYDIEVVIVTENHAALQEFVAKKLSRIKCIRRFAVSLGLEMFKYSTEMGPLLEPAKSLIGFPRGGALDATNKAIIEALRINPRRTNQSIAGDLDLSESAVRARINAMLNQNLIRITAMRNMQNEKGEVFASIGVELQGRDVSEVARELTEVPGIGFVVTVLGRYQILVMGLLDSASEVSTSVINRIERIPGVHKIYASQVLRFEKYDQNWTAVLD